MPVLTLRVDIANARIAFRGRVRRQPDRVARFRRAGCASSGSSRRRSTAPWTCRPGRSAPTGSRGRGGAGDRLSGEVARRPGEPLARELADFAAAVRSRRDRSGLGRAGPGALGAGRPTCCDGDRGGTAPVGGRRSGVIAGGAHRPRSAAAASTTLPALEGAARGSGSRRPFGRPSRLLRHGTLGGVPVAFLPRHGRGHRSRPDGDQLPRQHLRLQDARLRRDPVASPPSEACARSTRRAHAVVPDQFIDRTRHRADTLLRRRDRRPRRVRRIRSARCLADPRSERARPEASTVARAAAPTSAWKARSSPRARSRRSTAPGARTSSA